MNRLTMPVGDTANAAMLLCHLPLIMITLSASGGPSLISGLVVLQGVIVTFWVIWKNQSNCLPTLSFHYYRICKASDRCNVQSILTLLNRRWRTEQGDPDQAMLRRFLDSVYYIEHYKEGSDELLYWDVEGGRTDFRISIWD